MKKVGVNCFIFDKLNVNKYNHLTDDKYKYDVVLFDNKINNVNLEKSGIFLEGEQRFILSVV